MSKQNFKILRLDEDLGERILLNHCLYNLVVVAVVYLINGVKVLAVCMSVVNLISNMISFKPTSKNPKKDVHNSTRNFFH